VYTPDYCTFIGTYDWRLVHTALEELRERATRGRSLGSTRTEIDLYGGLGVPTFPSLRIRYLQVTSAVVYSYKLISVLLDMCLGLGLALF
jgi:hypothetical protein